MKISIRAFITLPVLVLTFMPAAVVGLLAYSSSQRSIEKIAEDLVAQISNRIRDRVGFYLTTPHFINRLNANAIASGVLNPNDPRQLERHFARQLSAAFPVAQATGSREMNNEFNRSINHIYLGTRDGTFFGAEYRPREEDDPDSDWIIAISRAEPATNSRFRQYEVLDPNGQLEVADEALAPPGNNPYDPRKRPWWFSETETPDYSNQPNAGWSEVYCDLTTSSPVITAVRRASVNGEFQGVLGGDFLFSDVRTFLIDLLADLDIPPADGQIFILDQEDRLLSTSNDQITTSYISQECEQSGLQLTPARDIQESVISDIVGRSHPSRDSSEPDSLQRVEFQGDRYFWFSLPIQDDYGLRWSAYILIHERHFMAEIYRNRLITFVLCSATVLAALGLGVVVSSQIVNPVLKLERATKNLVDSIHDEQDIQTLQVGKNPSELYALAQTFEEMTKQLKSSFVAFGHFVPRNFLSALGYQRPTDVRLGDSKVVMMTMLFADIRSFTQLSEAMNPEETFQFINTYLRRMEPAIAQNGGFIDKYIGDGIMALFEEDDSPDQAIKAGLAMLQQLEAYNQQRAPQQPPVRIGIGIHTGKIILGTVGGENRWDTTVVGCDVNRASRVEGLTKDFQASLLISGQTLALLRHTYQHRYLGATPVRGMEETLDIYEIYEADPPDLLACKQHTLATFQTGVRCYQDLEYARALEQFEAVLEACAQDGAAQYYAQRCRDKLGKKSWMVR
ncbi:MAG: adenylate/guanylate cyclase domain-containing protein [Synechococcales bacterium]|nr:adenylate/guanylate cyclase domain-containing protein [Synechococcales bacterium]